MSDTEQRTVVAAALARLREKYIFPDKASEAAAAIEARMAAGEYDDLDDEGLAERITAQFYEVCADRHLRLRVRPLELRDTTTEAEEIAAWNEQLRVSNYHIAAVRRLDGNVGYLDLRGVAAADVAGPAIAAAMELVSHTEALIIDLRKNRGGDPDGVQLWNSYLFPDGETHLNDIYDGGSKRTRQFWTLAYVPGRRYTGRPVYVLTSATTFSAGEEFAYNLKVLGRATLIGEVTRGGAHPTEWLRASDTLVVTVPTARSVNPVTGTNWEGVGVAPDIATPAAEAFDRAYRLALEHVVATSPAPTVQAEATEALASLR